MLSTHYVESSKNLSASGDTDAGEFLFSRTNIYFEDYENRIKYSCTLNVNSLP